MTDQQTTEENKFIRVNTLKIDTIDTIFKSIADKPGFTSDIAKKELGLFQFRTRDNKLEICIPKKPRCLCGQLGS